MSDAPHAIAWTSGSLEQTLELGRTLGSIVKPGDVIGLVGSPGAGKTQLVRGLAEGIDADPRLVSSPTFVLACEYEGRHTLIHIDAYRIESLSDLESIGWESQRFVDVVTVIEWADRIADHLPGDCLMIELEHLDEARRRITMCASGSWAERIVPIRQQFTGDARCPICEKPVLGDSPFFPFCCERCRMVDLNRWFNGDYSIGRPYDPLADDV